VSRPLQEAAPALLRRIGDAAALFCALDYDGTLAPLAPTPGAAIPYSGTAALLTALAAAPRTSVVIVTGRTIPDVQRLLHVPQAAYIGVHGAQQQLRGGGIETIDRVRPLRVPITALYEELQRAVGAVPGVLLEHKEVAIACHVRLAAAADAARVTAAVTAMARARIRGGLPLVVSHGHAVVEIRPAGVDKGTALIGLLAGSPAETLAMYIGDDETDEDAFAALRAGAVTVRVGADAATAAQYVVPDVAAVHDWLTRVRAARAPDARTHGPAGS